MSLFVCPLCGGALSEEANRRVCPRGHSFDRAREGYVNLLLSQKSHAAHHGDDVRMVAARRRFLERGYYAGIRDALTSLCLDRAEKGVRVLDAGCGEGYYTAAVAAALHRAGCEPQTAGADISREAVRQAGKRDRTLEWAVASVFRLPVAAGGVDLLLSLFAPKAPEEWARVLRPGGTLCRVVPLENHLFELKEAVYASPYKDTPEEPALPGFRLLRTERVREKPELTSAGDIADLFAMTPYYYRTSAADRAKLDALSRLAVTVDCALWVYERV